MERCETSILDIWSEADVDMSGQWPAELVRTGGVDSLRWGSGIERLMERKHAKLCAP